MKIDLPQVGFQDTLTLVSAILRSNQVPALIGSPGIGKTALLREVADSIGLPLQVLIASNMEATDVAGLPFLDRGDDGGSIVKRQLFHALRMACEKPVLLFLDEASTMQMAVQGPMLRLALERVVGDDLKLHEGTRVALALNHPEECPGGLELSPALVNRLVLVNFIPTHEELVQYFSDEKWEPDVRREFIDFVVTSGFAPLFEMSPPPNSLNMGMPWGSPRAWQRGLECLAALKLRGDVGVSEDVESTDTTDIGANTTESKLAVAVLAGSVGLGPAVRFLKIRGRRTQLPSIADIVANPSEVPISDAKEIQIAAIGLVLRVAEERYWAAWIFTKRLRPEIQAAIGERVLTNRAPSKDRNTFKEEGRAAQYAILTELRK